MSRGMFTEGVSNRSSPTLLHPVFHVLTADPDVGWRTWCGYGKAREVFPGQYPTPLKLCAKCKTLVRERITADEDEADFGRDDAPRFVDAVATGRSG